ncbi:MAG TPA: hypothetical protein VHV51_02080 [Polyangiaceae bacterium]|nr:hypothetical protein [Polyangiaceae bacterium]
MVRARIRLLAWVAALGLCAASACETDHDALEKMPNQGPIAAGSGGHAGTSTQMPTAGSSGTSGGTGGHPDDEPPGASVLTIVHGVVDAPSIALCLATVADGGAPAPFGKPLSDAPLDFGQSLVLSAIDGADPANDVIQPFVIAGELEFVSGLDCAGAIALAQTEEAAVASAETAAAGASAGEGGAGEGGAGGAPPEVQARLRVRALPAFPAGTLNGGRSYLLVALGCMGGSGYDASNAEAYCGAGYSETAPTFGAAFAAMSRATSSGGVGLQVMQASLATDSIRVDSAPPPLSPDQRITIATGVAEGELWPRPAYIDHSAADYDVSTTGLEITSQVSRPFSQSWLDVLARGAIGMPADGSNYTIVLIGPRTDLTNTALWNAPAITIVPVDPK